MDSANVIPSAQPQIYRSSVPWKRRAVFIHPEDQYQRCVLSAEEEEAFEREELPYNSNSLNFGEYYPKSPVREDIIF
ncbi:unnamed protein product [Linum tenue]|uniref:Uncharacterized protein n=1 Tax=Linum tenue TaxID=586396 RepID=A0AAV0N3F9_9ROSI|nr:unnamed protein product [Linum tenue]CAI0553648.1 unnamed protein product [Linum tenue]